MAPTCVVSSHSPSVPCRVIAEPFARQVQVSQDVDTNFKYCPQTPKSLCEGVVVMANMGEVPREHRSPPNIGRCTLGYISRREGSLRRGSLESLGSLTPAFYLRNIGLCQHHITPFGKATVLSTDSISQESNTSRIGMCKVDQLVDSCPSDTIAPTSAPRSHRVRSHF